MDLITPLCFIAVAAIVGVAVWWARRENARLDAEALAAFSSPMDAHGWGDPDGAPR
jgi:uncharacterized iron-regulated membrane protein